MPALLVEAVLDLSFTGLYGEQRVMVYHAKARVVDAFVRREPATEKFIDTPVLLIRDSGMVHEVPKNELEVVVVRGAKNLTPFPEVCGAYLARLRHDHQDFFVFERREPPKEKLVTPPAEKKEESPWPL